MYSVHRRASPCLIGPQATKPRTYRDEKRTRGQESLLLTCNGAWLDVFLNTDHPSADMPGLAVTGVCEMHHIRHQVPGLMWGVVPLLRSWYMHGGRQRVQEEARRAHGHLERRGVVTSRLRRRATAGIFAHRNAARSTQRRCICFHRPEPNRCQQAMI